MEKEFDSGRYKFKVWKCITTYAERYSSELDKTRDIFDERILGVCFISQRRNFNISAAPIDWSEA